MLTKSIRITEEVWAAVEAQALVEGVAPSVLAAKVLKVALCHPVITVDTSSAFDLEPGLASVNPPGFGRAVSAVTRFTVPTPAKTADQLAKESEVERLVRASEAQVGKAAEPGRR